MFNSSGYVRHFKTCNQHNLQDLMPFSVDGKNLGWVSQETLSTLLAHSPDFIRLPESLTLAPHLQSFAARSAALQNAATLLAAHYGKQLRHEMYPLCALWGDEPLAQIDRSAVPWFGTPAFGVHVNGYVKKADGIYLWIGERAANRTVDPGMLDNMIGGGQPIGISIRDNLRKEAQEEAGLPASIIDRAQHARTLRYKLMRNQGLRNDTLYVFDIELPHDVIPTNTDGEVAAFHLMPAEDVARIIHDTNKFKFNCNIVIIDFLIRHHVITSQDPEYKELMDLLPSTHKAEDFRS